MVFVAKSHTVIFSNYSRNNFSSVVYTHDYFRLLKLLILLQSNPDVFEICVLPGVVDSLLLTV
jgi:hypothetical protein